MAGPFTPTFPGDDGDPVPADDWETFTNGVREHFNRSFGNWAGKGGRR